MFSPTTDQIKELCKFAYLSDKEIRGDLARGYIRDENDYTSNFTGALRRNINCYSQFRLSATSLMLSTGEERGTGCDATIIVHSNGQTKIALFEAKFPRLKKSGYSWDYPQTASGLSHFSDQLERQSKLDKTFAVFEMFYCEYEYGTQPVYMQNDVSSCVWHTDAITFDKNRSVSTAPWTPNELDDLLINGNMSISEVLQQVCECKAGYPLSMINPEAIAREFRLYGNILYVDCGNDSSQTED